MLHLGEVWQLLPRGGQLPLSLLSTLSHERQLALQGGGLVSAQARLALGMEGPRHGMGRICQVGVHLLPCLRECALRLRAQSSTKRRNEEKKAAKKRKRKLWRLQLVTDWSHMGQMHAVGQHASNYVQKRLVK